MIEKKGMLRRNHNTEEKRRSQAMIVSWKSRLIINPVSEILEA